MESFSKNKLKEIELQKKEIAIDEFVNTFTTKLFEYMPLCRNNEFLYQSGNYKFVDVNYDAILEKLKSIYPDSSIILKKNALIEITLSWAD